MPGLIYVISGPSGAGKSTIIDELRKKVSGLAYSISHTTREPRGQEKDGVEYHFVKRSGFEELIEQGGFVEWAEVYGEYYGTSFSSLKDQLGAGYDVIMDVDIQGAENIRKSFGDSVLIYVLPPSLEALKLRLKGRGSDSKEAIEKRFEKATHELTQCTWYDYIIFNDDLDRAVRDAASIVYAERCRRTRKLPDVWRIFQISPPG